MAARVVEVKFDQRDAKRAAAEAAREFKSAFDRIRSGASSAEASLGGVSTRVDGLTSAFKGLASIGVASILTGIASGITAVGVAALKAAADIDKARSTLRALTGSTEAANAKLGELRKLAQSSPGVTVQLATQAFSQLRATTQLTDQAINKLIQGVGKLNAVFTLENPQLFIRNITQIFTQGFERQDIKEALGQVPIFEELLRNAFGTSDPEKLRKLKAAGKLTLDTYIGGLSETFNNDKRLAGITESIGTRFEKIKDQILTSLAPIGDQLANVIGPILERIAPRVEELSKNLAAAFRDSQGDIGRLTDSIFRLLDALKGFGPVLELIKQGLDTMLITIRTIADVVSSLIENLSKFGNSLATLRDLALRSTKGPVAFQNGRFVQLSNEATGQRQGRFAEQLQNDPTLAGIGGASPLQFQGLKDARGNPISGRPFAFGLDNNRTAIEDGLRSQIRDLRQQLRIPVDKPFSKDLDAEIKNLLKQKEVLNKGEVDSEKKKNSELRAIEQARLDLKRDTAERLTKLEQDRIKRDLQENQFEFEQKRKTLREFSDERLSLNQQLVQSEIKGIQDELKAVFGRRDAIKIETAERIRLDNDILKLKDQLIEKERELGRIAIDNTREFRKQLQDRFTQERPQLQRGQVSISRLGAPLTLDEAIAQAQALEEQRKRNISETDKNTRESLLDLERRREEVQNKVFLGVKTEAQGRQEILGIQREIADIETRRLEAEALRKQNDPERLAEIRLELERLKALGQDLKPAEAFLKGLSNETELLSEKLTNLGRNFRDTFVDSFTELLVSGRNTFGNLFNVVKTAIARMSAELIASQLFRFFANGQTSGGAGGPAGGGSSSGGGGGLLQSILGIGSGGNLRTPPFVAAGATAGGGNLGLTGSVSDILGQITQSRSSSPIPLSDITTGSIGGLSNDTAIARRAIEAGSSPVRGTGFGSILGQFGGNLKNLFKGIGFGKAPGTAGGLAGALPLLGLTFGAGTGGSSILGQILGGAGGVLAGIGLSAAPAGLAASSPALAALFSNPITAIAGAGLLVGAIFLGRASQRRKDEEASGDFLQQAIDGIAQLREAVSTDQITGAQARATFSSDILGTFRAQIGTLKTKSVRESRLTNQVRDLQNLFNTSVEPEIIKQAERMRVGSRLTPEFATGGVVPGFNRGFDSVTARLTPGEMVLNQRQQFNVAAISGNPGIFQAAGVPSAGAFMPNGSQAFAGGGVAQDGGDIVINFENVTLNVTEGEAERISIAGLTSNTGRRIQIDNVKQAKRDGQLA
jgi:hypothetical protein